MVSDLLGQDQGQRIAGAVVFLAIVAPCLIFGLDSEVLRRAEAAAWDREDQQSAWENGPPSGPEHFPLAVWLQSPSNAAAYREIGINLYIGLWQGPTDEQLDALTAAGMPVMADQNAVGLARADDPIIQGWIQQDEPDNAQPDGQGGYGPCIEPAVIRERYDRMRENDPTRPVFLNLGQGVAWDEGRPYVGRGSHCADRWDQYPEYARGSDILSFDIYPVTSRYEHIQGRLWRVALGVDRLREWGGPDKTIWNVIETAHINAEVRPTPEQIRAEVWMSVIHGSRGIVYFAHEWVPQFREAALLHYPEIREGVARINAELTELAPAIHAPADPDALRVTVSDPEVPIDTLVTHHGDWTYVFAVSMRDVPVTAGFELPARRGRASRVEVLGEDRSIDAPNGSFEDRFEGYAVHLYRLPHQEGMRLLLPWLRR